MEARYTTIELEQDGDAWRATQQGVDLVGRGETAACRGELLRAGRGHPAPDRGGRR